MEQKIEKPLLVESRIDPRYDLTALTVEDAEFLASFSEEARKRVIWKVDIRLIPMLTILHLISFLDRSNMGNAKIKGLDDELQLDGVKYNIALCIFFVPYILCEIPSNFLLAIASRPSLFLGAMIVAWGIIMALTGVVQNFAGLCVTRLFLGFEAGFFPGAIYLVSTDVMIECVVPAERITTAGAFSGLLAFAIANMDGAGGYRAWRWIFIIKGPASALAGVAAILFMPDSPRSYGCFLTSDEIRYLEVRQLAVPGRRKHGHAESGSKHFDWKNLVKLLKELQRYLFAIVCLSSTVPNYALNFVSSILSTR
ncbi:putative Major facilitator superfamily (MFS) profile domain-containing protein [Seiridium cardinale]